MEGEIMFNLLYMKYQKEIMRPYRGKFKDLNLYEKIFLIVLISDASLFAVFSFLNLEFTIEVQQINNDP